MRYIAATDMDTSDKRRCEELRPSRFRVEYFRHSISFVDTYDCYRCPYGWISFHAAERACTPAMHWRASVGTLCVLGELAVFVNPRWRYGSDTRYKTGAIAVTLRINVLKISGSQSRRSKKIEGVVTKMIAAMSNASMAAAAPTCEIWSFTVDTEDPDTLARRKIWDK